MTTTRLEKSINGLKEISDRHKRSYLFDFSLPQIIIKPKMETKLGLWFYFVLLIATPVGFLIYQLAKSKPEYYTIFLLIILIVYFLTLFIKLIKGQQYLIVDLTKKEFIFEPIHKILFTNSTSKFIDFDNITKVELRVKSLNMTRWSRLNFIDKAGNVISYIDLGGHYVILP